MSLPSWTGNSERLATASPDVEAKAENSGSERCGYRAGSKNLALKSRRLQRLLDVLASHFANDAIGNFSLAALLPGPKPE